MATATEEVTVDIEALDAAAAKKAEKQSEKAAAEPKVIVDPEVTAKNGAADALTPEQGIEKLQKQLKDERAAREAADSARASAETRAREASKAEAEARGRVQTTELDLVKNAIATVTQANDALESKYAESMAAQDWAGAAKLQRQMGDNSAKLAQLEAGKTHLERQPKPTARVPVDAVEQYISTIGPEYPRSREWLRAHPEFIRDENKNQQMIAAHQLATARGYKADTDDYFRSVEKTLDLTAAATTNGAGNGVAHAGETDPLADPSAAAATGGRQTAPAAAPVSRSGTAGNGSRSNVVRLSADEVEVAQNMGMTVEEYARNKMALKKEGKLS
jgi:hypothetical protein